MKKLLIALAFCFVGSFYATEDKNKQLLLHREANKYAHLNLEKICRRIKVGTDVKPQGIVLTPALLRRWQHEEHKNKANNFAFLIEDELIVGTNVEVSSNKKLPELGSIHLIGWVFKNSQRCQTTPLNKYPFN